MTDFAFHKNPNAPDGEPPTLGFRCVDFRFSTLLDARFPESRVDISVWMFGWNTRDRELFESTAVVIHHN